MMEKWDGEGYEVHTGVGGLRTTAAHGLTEAKLESSALSIGQHRPLSPVTHAGSSNSFRSRTGDDLRDREVQVETC